MPHLSGPRRYFFHHSYRVLSLQNCPSLAGKTGGTRIDKYRPLVMPPRFVRQLRNNTAQSLVQPSCSALICSPPCSSKFRLYNKKVRFELSNRTFFIVCVKIIYLLPLHRSRLCRKRLCLCTRRSCCRKRVLPLGELLLEQVLLQVPLQRVLLLFQEHSRLLSCR